MKNGWYYAGSGAVIGALICWLIMLGGRRGDDDTPRLERLVQDSVRYVTTIDSITVLRKNENVVYMHEMDSVNSLLEKVTRRIHDRPSRVHSSNADTLRMQILRASGVLDP